MKLLVCGGRDYADRARVYATLDKLCPSEVIQGGARGADRLALDWANSRLIRSQTFTADWERHGKGAGPIRNQTMIDQGRPDAVLAFPGGRGTADMVRRARAAGVRVIEPFALSLAI